jgi:hypothetical protein
MRRELDVKVAEALGWGVWEWQAPRGGDSLLITPPGDDPNRYLRDEYDPLPWVRVPFDASRKWGDWSNTGKGVPHYSTDTEASVELWAEHLPAGWSFSHINSWVGSDNKTKLRASGRSLPEAICNAILAVKEAK